MQQQNNLCLHELWRWTNEDFHAPNGFDIDANASVGFLDIKSLTNPIASEAVQEVQCVYDLGVQTDFEYWSVKIDDFFLCPSNEINFIDSDKDVR